MAGLFLASIFLFMKFQPNGTISSAAIPMCSAKAVAWVQLQFSSFDQISFTLMGLLVTFSGGNLFGKKTSFRRSVKLPKFPPQSTSRRLLTTLFGAVGADRKNLRLSVSPPVLKVFRVNGASLRSITFTGASKRNCLRLDQKSSGMRWAGVPKSGNAARGTGITSSGPVRFGLLSSSGRR